MSRKRGLFRGRWDTGPDLMLWSGGAYLAAAILLALLHVDVTGFFDPGRLLPDRAFAAMVAWNPDLDYLPSFYACMLALLLPVTVCFLVHIHVRRTFLRRIETTRQLVLMLVSAVAMAALPLLLLAYGYRDVDAIARTRWRAHIMLVAAHELTIAVSFFLLFAFSALMLMFAYGMVLKLQDEPMGRWKGAQW